MKKNRTVREELERIYGKHCMIHEGIRKLNPPKVDTKRYKGKSIAQQITLHHLKPLRDKGPTTVENGSLICRSCHDWLEALSNVEREKVNNMLRQYKARFVGLEITGNGEIGNHVAMDLDDTEEYIEIPLYPNREEKEDIAEANMRIQNEKQWWK